MQTIKGVRLRIMVLAFQIRINNGESFEKIAEDYPRLTQDDLNAIKKEL